MLDKVVSSLAQISHDSLLKDSQNRWVSFCGDWNVYEVATTTFSL